MRMTSDPVTRVIGLTPWRSIRSKPGVQPRRARPLSTASAAAAGLLLACVFSSSEAQIAKHEYELLVSNTAGVDAPVILRFDAASGAKLGALDLPREPARGPDAPLGQPYYLKPSGLALDQNGALSVGYSCYYACPGQHVVLRYAMAAGALLRGIAFWGEDVFGGPPQALAASADGSLVLIAGPNSAHIDVRDAGSGEVLHSYPVSNSPRGATLGPDGEFYVQLQVGSRAEVLRIDPTGQGVETFVALGSGGLDSDGGPAGLAFDGRGDLHVLSSGSDVVLRYDGTSGAYIDRFAEPAVAGCEEPAGLTFGPHDGHLYVMCSDNGKVARFDAGSGEFIDFFAQGLTGPTYGVFSRMDHPAAPRLLSPDGASFDQREGVVLRWRPAADERVVSYRVRVAFDPEFQFQVSSFETPSTQFLATLSAEDFDYFWRVEALDISGRVIALSPETFSFSVTAISAPLGFTALTGLVKSNLNQAGITGATVSISSPRHVTGQGTIVTQFNGEYIVIAQTTVSSFNNQAEPVPFPIQLTVTGPDIAPTVLELQESEVVGATIRRDIQVPVQTPSRMSSAPRRAWVETGPRALHRWFRVKAGPPVRVLIRGIGPSFNPASAGLGDPRLKVFEGRVLKGANNDWANAANADQIRATGLAPTHPREPAILVTLPPGLYHVIFDDRNGGVGWGQLAVVELDPGPTPRMVEVSSRAQVAPGGRLLLGWVDVIGNTPKRVLIRGRGPSISIPFPKLQDPSLQVSKDGAVIASNDNWASSPSAAEVANSGRAPRNPREPALVLTLNPGRYALVLSGKAGDAGISILEAFELPN